jgi:hypothetical protein
VAGEIAIRIYDLAINYIGETPNLVGNLLNEGSTEALFTTIELVQSTGENGGTRQLSSGLPPQYIGDLSENSPLPFSIPLNLPRNAEPGSYPVILKVTYKDDLRDAHEFVTSGTAVLEAQQSGNQAERQGFPGTGLGLPVMGLMLPLVIGGIAAAIAAVLIIRRRKHARTKKLLAQKEEDSIETILGNPGTDPKKDQST